MAIDSVNFAETHLYTQQKIRSFKSCPVLNLAASRFHKGQEVRGHFFPVSGEACSASTDMKGRKIPKLGIQASAFRPTAAV